MVDITIDIINKVRVGESSVSGRRIEGDTEGWSRHEFEMISEHV